VIPKAGSSGEEAFALHCRAEGLAVEREYKFHPTRKWRFDFAFPEQKLGIEIEGGLYVSGRHSRGAGYESDMRKYNEAVKMGWRVLRYSTAMVLAGDAVGDVLEVLWLSKIKMPPQK